MANLTLKQKYEKEVKPALAKELKIANPMAVPQLVKVVVNMGTGQGFRDKEGFAKLQADLAAITGQKPKVQSAHISVAGFNLRAGMSVGLSTTLRGDKMYAFLEKLIAVVLPRLRDFRGVPTKSFDKSGNYTLGLVEHTVFPEIDLAKVDKPHGLEVTIVNTARNKEEGKMLLELLGMPFIKEEN
jgi:large subunit ribosomal protein L5